MQLANLQTRSVEVELLVLPSHKLESLQNAVFTDDRAAT
jgi:hypothetical protein